VFQGFPIFYKHEKTMKSKSMRSIIFPVLIIQLAAQIAAIGQSEPPIVMPDGSKVSLLGVTYGTHHVPPGYEADGKKIRSIDTPSTNSTVVWLAHEHDPNEWRGYNLLLSDDANTEIIPLDASVRCYAKDDVEVDGYLLRAFPRWEKEFVLSIVTLQNLKVLKDTITVENPHPVSMEKFKTEPLPAKKSDGDFKVTLTKLEADAPLPPYERHTDLPLTDARNKCVRIGFELSDTNWQPLKVETSDAIGDHMMAFLELQSSDLMRKYLAGPHPLAFAADDDYRGYYYRWGLWPEEPAWKIRLEFMRTSGFDTAEILSLTDIPVRAGRLRDYYAELSWRPGQTNNVLEDYTVNGIELKLLAPFLIHENNGLHLKVMIRSDFDLDANNIHITILKATDDQDQPLDFRTSPASGNGSFELVNSHDMKTLNLKLAVHRSRFVEFNVKPTE